MLTALLVVRALRWRAGAAACAFAVAVIAVAAAVLGPLYLHAVDGGVLRQTLLAADRADRDVTATISSSPIEKVDWTSAVSDMVAPVLASRWFVPAVSFATADIELAVPGQGGYRSRVLHADGDCAHLRIVAGRCPNAAGEVMVSQRTLDAGLGVGDDADATPSGGEEQHLRVVGVYEPRDPAGDYWGGTHFFDAGPTTSDKELPRLDSFVVAASTIDDLRARVPVDYGAEARLSVPSVRVGDLHAMGKLLDAANARAAAHSDDGASIDTTLSSLFDDVRAEQRVPRTLVVVASVQLALLALVVLGAIVWSTTDAHVDEAALARLRGRRAGTVVMLAVGQPAAAVTLALPAGAAVGWAAASALSPTLVGAGGTVATTSAAIWLAVAVTVVGVFVCIAVAGRAFLAPVGSLFRRAGPSSRAPVTRLVAEAVVLTVAVVGVLELKTRGLASNGKPDAVAVLVPTLIAAGAAVVMLHLAPLAARPLLALTRDRNRVAAFIAVRQLARRDTALRLSAAVAVAVSIAVFAAASWSNAARNRQLRAWGDVGAAQVLTVQPNAGVDLIGAVRSADPSGREAMAVESRAGAATPILAVDSARLPGVAAWVAPNSEFSLRQIAGWLHPPAPPPIMLVGTKVRLAAQVEQLPAFSVQVQTFTDSGDGLVQTGSEQSRQPPVHMVLLASDPEHRPVRADLGQARLGTATYQGELSSDCIEGCRLVGLTLTFADDVDSAVDAPPAQSVIKYLGIEVSSRGDTYAPVDDGFTQAQRWQGTGSDTPVAGPGGLETTLRYDSSPWPGAPKRTSPAPERSRKCGWPLVRQQACANGCARLV